MVGSLGGAVDLSAFANNSTPNSQSSAQPAAQPGTQEATGQSVAGPIITELTAESIEAAVNLSATVPVVLAFHSDRSENSGQLLTKLEALAASYKGRFQLAKVNVDQDAQVAQAFSVNAVPAAAALLQGQPVPLFQGLPDDVQLEQTISQLLAAAAQYGINGVLDGGPTPEPELPPLHKKAQEAIAQGDFDTAQAAYKQALAEGPGDTQAQLGLDQVELALRMRALNPTSQPDVDQQVLAQVANAPLTDVEAHLAAADVEFSYNRPDAALARLIDVVKVTSGDAREAARKRIIAYFNMLGDDPIVAQARKALTNALF